MSDWKANVYHRVSEPQFRWGRAVLDALTLRGDETVMDAGCGTGRLTALLAERVPRGKVVALDASPAMIDVARQELASFGERVRLVRATLGQDALPGGVDVVFSTATFHWVLDHDELFRSIAAALVPGGRLHAQCGGAGNLHGAHHIVHEVSAREPYAPHLADMPDPWLFADVASTRARLERAGFEHAEVSLQNAPTPFASPSAYAEFVGAVVLRPYLARLPLPLHERFVADVTARAGAADPPFLLDYVRLDIRASTRRN